MTGSIERVWTVPNALSLVRLVLAIAVFAMIERQAHLAAFVGFVIAASTDWIDGWYARRFAQVSRLGRIFDPLVDKVLVCGAAILVAAPDGPIRPWMAVVIVVRELVVTALRAEMERSGRDFSAGPAGKLKMVLQCVAIALVLADRAGVGMRLPEGFAMTEVAAWTAWAAVVATA
ncbi:MAG: CDP-diacylglycerol--glycerol-3-phosphate 3-phosphatidyltransferase, partial [Planctomycetaceae bacterium]